MAAGLIPAPGTERGPCAEPCAHTDCERSRMDAGSECAICHEPVGYERRFYRDRWSSGVFIYTHATCIFEKDARATKLRGEA